MPWGGGTRRLAALVALLGAVLAGCGGSSSGSSSSRSATSTTASLSTFKQGFATRKASFTKLGHDLGAAIRTAPKHTDVALAAEFATLSTRATSQAAALRSLSAPARFQPEVSRLAGDFDTVAADLHKISSYASSHNAAGAKAAAETLIVDAAALKKVDLAISGELGLP